MNTDNYGIVTLNIDDLIKGLYSGKITNLNEVISEKQIADQFNSSININKDSFNKLKHYIPTTQSLEDFDKLNQNTWFMPNDYCPNLVEMLYGMCETDEQKDRVTTELELFIQHGMFDLLFYLKYLVDTMRKHNIVWGVGRGSSVSSYVLYLIGVHKINSIKYNLDIREFLK